MTDTTQQVTLKGTLGRVYGGDEEKVHIADGQRGSFGVALADTLDRAMRQADPDSGDKPLCPGCYMIALLGAAITLAQRNGQSLVELGQSMSYAFTQIADADTYTAPILPEEMLIAPFAEAAARRALNA